MKSLLITFCLVALLIGTGVLLMSVRIILKRGGKFSSAHISASKPMRERGITCATSTDRRDRKMQDHKLDLKNM